MQQGFRINDWRVEPQLNTLTGPDKTAHVEPKMMQVLLCLAEQAGQVIPKERLIQRVWPDTFVSDDVLTRSIGELRRAFGDDAKEPRFIQTIPRSGYRLIARVSLPDTEATSNVLPEPEPAAQLETAPTIPNRDKASRLTFRRLALASVAGLFVAGFAIVPFRAPRRADIPLPYVPIPLNAYPGQEQQPAFSPDARQIAFIWNRGTGEDFNIYTQALAGGNPFRITHKEAMDVSPAWSPDGRRIAFVRISGESHADVFVVPSTGGPEIHVIGLREGAARPWMVTRSWLAWTPDGNGLVVADRNEGGRGFDLFLVPLSYGPRRRLTTPSPGWGDSAPAFAPGGRSLAFIRSLSAVDGDVFVLPLTAEFGPASEPRRLSSLHRLTSGLTWTADGHDIVFASGQIGASRLWRVSVATGAAPQLVPFVAEDALWPSISSEGHLAYAVSQSDTDIWRTPLDGSGAPQRWIASTRDDQDPQYSPDGLRVLFISKRSGSSELWIANADGSDASQLTYLRAFFLGSPHWSPDGSTIVFDSPRDGRFAVYTVSAAGGGPRKLTDSEAPCAAASYSRDGRWIYYHCVEGGTSQIWRMPAQGGHAERVAPGFAQSESHDGRYLYFATHSTSEVARPLWRIPVEGGEPVQILPDVEPFNYAVTRDGIYFGSAPDYRGRCFIQFLHMPSRRISTVATYTGLVAQGISVSPDGKWLLYSYDERRNSDLMLVERFH